MNKFHEAVVAPYLDKSIDELYAELARETVNPDQALPGISDLIASGKLRFEQVLDRVRPVICKPEVLSMLTLNSESKQLAVAIGDIISTVITGQPLVLVSVLVAKVGLNVVCRCKPRLPAAP